MPRLRVAHDERGTHHTTFPAGSSPYQQGEKQATLSIERYHTLVAALTKKYSFRDCPGTGVSALLPGSRKEVDLSAYTAYKLSPITDVKLHPGPDGTFHPGDLEAFRGFFEDDWKMQEGGILYCLADSRAFWNCLISYHGPAQTTGMEAWDELFRKLEATGYAKNIIPCMVRPPLFTS
jgi:hypothetical protein